jgi:hypothetical protein
MDNQNQVPENESNTEVNQEKTIVQDTPVETQPTPKKKKGWGCLGCGVIGCIGIFVLGLVSMLGLGYWVKTSILSTTPIEVPPTYLEAAEEAALKEKHMAWIQELEDYPGEPAAIIFTDREINSLFNNSSEEGKPWFNLSIDGEKTTFSFSMPLNQQNNLFLNMSGRGILKVIDEQFEFKLDKLTLGKFTLKDKDFLDAFVEGFIEALQDSEEYEKLEYRLVNMNIDDGVVFLEIKKVK